MPLADALASWGADLPLREGVAKELGRFRKGRSTLPEPYVRAFPAETRRSVFELATAGLARLSRQGCQPYVEVTFPGADGGDRAGGDPVAGAFADGVVRTEAVACFRDLQVSPSQALELYTDPSFRMETEGRIERIERVEDLSCVETAGAWGVVDPMLSCSAIERLDLEGLAAEHSQVVSNPGPSGHQIVFFKESLKTFLSGPDGLALHYVNVSRTVDLGSLARAVARRKLEQTQRELTDALDRALRQQAPGSR